MLDKTWYKSKVIHGKKLGQSFGFPTLNLNNPEVLSGEKEGVYLAKVNIDSKLFCGLLYYGPRLILKETKKILEIYLFDFQQQIYGKIIKYQIISYLRAPINFADIKSFRKQMMEDIKKAKAIIQSLQSN